MRRTETHSAGSWALAVAFCAVTVTVLLSMGAPVLHWMILPTFACGVLIGVDAAAWALGRLGAFDPRGLLGLFGTHYFFLVPLLHVSWDYWPHFVAPAVDWREALGVLGTINLAGLLIYRFVLGVPLTAPAAAHRPVTARAFSRWGSRAALLSFLAFLGLLASYGGISDYIQVVTSNREALDNAGPALLVAEAWPLLVFTVVAVTKRSRLAESRALFAILILGFVLAQFATGGLRGSRSNTIWPTLIALGIAHVYVRQISRKALAVGAVAFLGFMYVYGLYKVGGTDAISQIQDTSAVSRLETSTGRTRETVLLEDLGRAGIQAVVVDRVLQDPNVEFSWGRTYIGDVLKYLPESATGPVHDKVEQGTSILYGPASVGSEWRSSRIYGLTGEAVLNFGLLGAPFMFLPLALLVRKSAGIYQTARKTGELGSAVMASALGITAILAVGSDLDNVIWFLLKQVLPLAAVLFVARRSADSPQARGSTGRSRASSR